MITLETSKRTGIRNYQDHEISAFDLNWSRTLPRLFPRAVARTDSSPSYNCHGLTFASRRTKILEWSELQKILRDDAYVEIEMTDVMPGDIVIYLDQGDANHSGIVVEYRAGQTVLPIICSKWGSAGEFIHALRDCPSAYGPDIKFYRCKL